MPVAQTTHDRRKYTMGRPRSMQGGLRMLSAVLLVLGPASALGAAGVRMEGGSKRQTSVDPSFGRMRPTSSRTGVSSTVASDTTSRARRLRISSAADSSIRGTWPTLGTRICSPRSLAGPPTLLGVKNRGRFRRVLPVEPIARKPRQAASTSARVAAVSTRPAQRSTSCAEATAMRTPASASKASPNRCWSRRTSKARSPSNLPCWSPR